MPPDTRGRVSGVETVALGRELVVVDRKPALLLMGGSSNGAVNRGVLVRVTPWSLLGVRMRAAAAAFSPEEKRQRHGVVVVRRRKGAFEQKEQEKDETKK